MGKTISHVQGKGSITHNNRTFSAKNVNAELSKNNITFVKMSIEEAYDECFSAAVERYNEKQKRSDRKIKESYYQYAFNRAPCNTVVTASDKRKSFYEDVVQIGTKNDTGVGTPDAMIAQQCLTEYMNGFSERNPNFFVFNAVLHVDEATPHLHIDYIPIGHYKRGVDTQNGLAQALKEMGYGDDKNAISRWRERERDILTEICRRHGIEIDAPQEGRGHSFAVEEYKEYKDTVNELENKIDSLETQISDRSQTLNDLDNEINEQKEEYKKNSEANKNQLKVAAMYDQIDSIYNSAKHSWFSNSVSVPEEDFRFFYDLAKQALSKISDNYDIKRDMADNYVKREELKTAKEELRQTEKKLEDVSSEYAEIRKAVKMLGAEEIVNQTIQTIRRNNELKEQQEQQRQKEERQREAAQRRTNNRHLRR